MQTHPRPGPLAGTQLPTGTRGGIQEQRLTTETAERTPTRPKEASSASGAGAGQRCVPSVFSMAETPPELNSSARFQWQAFCSLNFTSIEKGREDES